MFMTEHTLRTAGIAAARDYQELPVWQKAVLLAEGMLAAPLPAELKPMACARAIDIATRIAAASVRPSEAGIAAGYQDAQSAAAELATILAVAVRTGFDAESTNAALDEIARLLIGMRHGLKVKAKDDERAERDSARREREFEQNRERPRREFKDRGERKPYGDKKPYGEKRGFGEKKPYGEKRGFGDKKPFGDRKPRGDRPFRKPRD